MPTTETREAGQELTPFHCGQIYGEYCIRILFTKKNYIYIITTVTVSDPCKYLNPPHGQICGGGGGGGGGLRYL